MSHRAILFLGAMLLFVTCAVPADELVIPASQLENLGVEFSVPQGADVADDFQVPARVRVPPSSDFAVVPVLAGTIKKLGVSAGDTVRRGDPVAWISSPDFLELQETYIDATHRLEIGLTRFSNDKTLNEEGIVSARRLSESKHEVADFRVAEQRLHHSLGLAGLKEVQIEALHETLQLQHEMVLRSPVDGVVLEEYRTAGQKIDPSQAVYRIADLSTLWLEMDVPFKKSLGIASGAAVFVTLGEHKVAASVTNIGRYVDEGNQTVIVRAVVEPGSDLAPGQFVTAMLTSRRSDNYLLLPAGSVIRRDDQDYVFVRSSEGVEAREIVVLRRSQGKIVVGSGIAAGDSVASSGTAALKARWLGMGGGD